MMRRAPEPSGGEMDAVINPASYQRSFNPMYEASKESSAPDTT